MKSYFNFVLLAGIILAIESRSLISASNFEEALRELQRILTVNKKLSTIISEKRSTGEIIDDGDFETQSLNKLQLMLKDFFARKNTLKYNNESIENLNDLKDFGDNKSSMILENSNSPKDFRADSVDKLDIYYHDGNGDDKHVKSRYEGSSMSPELAESEEDDDARKLDTMFIDLQKQINQMKQYSERLCRNHQSTESFATAPKSQDEYRSLGLFGSQF